MTAAILICTVTASQAEMNPVPPEECTGYDGAFEFDIPGIHDWWVAREIGCENPGYSWTVVSCATGETLDVVVEGFRTDSVKFDLSSELNVLREKYVNLDAPPMLTEVVSDLTAIGADPVVRDEHLDPAKFCTTGTVSNEGEAKL